ncbi:Dbl homology domain-containing protein, partial [Obba rivulosa]
SWRETLRSSTYKALLSHHGPTEMQRQEIIYELVTSEQVYVQCLDSIVQTYVLPLRSRDSKSWLPGVPPEISRLFDWLEDIVVLHEEMLHTVRGTALVWERGGVVERIAEPLRHFVPRLEVYQPYAVRVDEVKELVESCGRDGGDQFGEYIRMRERGSERQGDSLVHLLDEPITRLTYYRELFKVRVRWWYLVGRIHRLPRSDFWSAHRGSIAITCPPCPCSIPRRR